MKNKKKALGVTPNYDKMQATPCTNNNSNMDHFNKKSGIVSVISLRVAIYFLFIFLS